MIILIGFPKSGTSSFQELFHRCGYKTAHWKYKHNYIGTIINDNKKKGRPLLFGLEELDCITQMDVCISYTDNFWPQITDYKQLYEENPDAVFILNKRDPRDIVSYFKKWGHLNLRLFKYNSELVQDKSDKGIVDLINKHYDDVESFFKNKPKAKFISFHICKDNLSKLKPFVNVKGQTKLPVENKSKQTVEKPKYANLLF